MKIPLAVALAVALTTHSIAFAQPAADASPVLLDHAAEAAMRDRLAVHVLQVAVYPKPEPLQDPGFLPPRLGQAVLAEWDGRSRVITSLTLVKDAGRIETSRMGTDTTANATVARSEDDAAVAILEVHGGAASLPRPPLPKAPAAALDRGRLLFFLAPADAGRAVLANTVAAGPAGPALERFAIVLGRLPEGTPLFDADGGIAAVAVRLLPHAGDVERTLVLPMTAPAETVPESEGKSP